jgi:hypothetical protein
LGTGSDPTRIYRLGPYADLVNRAVDEFEQIAEPRGWALLIDPAPYRAVNPASDSVPAEITGLISDARVEDLAIAVNGVIRGMTRPYLYGSRELRAGKEGWIWATLVPEDALRAGANEIAVYAVERGADAVVLIPLPLCGPDAWASTCAGASSDDR